MLHYSDTNNISNSSISRNKALVIINALEQFECLTITQLGHMFFPHNEYNYYYARKKLKLMEDKDLIKSYIDINKNKKIYYKPIKSKNDKNSIVNNKPEITMHRMILMDFYSLLIYYGFEIKDYKFEYQWLNGKYRSDGLFIISKNDISQIIAIEVDFSHKTNLNKYEFIYKSREWENKFGVFPLVFIINSMGNKYEWKGDKSQGSSENNNGLEFLTYIYYLDSKFEHIDRILGLLG